MPLFAYKAIDTAGAENSGTVSAQSRLAALDEIDRKGLTPVSVDEQAKESARAGLHLGGNRVPQTVVEAFHRELANLLTAGVPMMRALSILCREATHPAAKRQWTTLHDDVAEGLTMADAMSKWPRSFPAVYVAMVRAGETGGFLDAVLAQVADFQASQRNLKSKIRSALAYPAVLAVLATGVLAFLLTYFIPRFTIGRCLPGSGTVAADCVDSATEMARPKCQFTKKDLRLATDPRSWQRGVGYFQDGRVELLMTDSGVIHARVAGNDDYRVQLRVEDGQVEGECSCPMGDDGVFCKHCVATGLAYLDGQAKCADQGDAPAGKKRRGRKGKAVTPDDVRAYLAGQDKDRLVELIMERLPWDDELRQKLFLRAARHDEGGLNVSAYRKAITDVTRVSSRGFVDYRSAPGFARRIDTAIDSVQELLDDGHGTEVIDLAEHAIARCGQALGGVDDSDGHMGSIMDRLAELHHAACLAARPDPEELARRLFRWELGTDWDTFYGAAEAYADVLGEKGLAIYRQLAQSMWDKLPALGPGDERHRLEGNRFRLTSVMESLARAAGDTEQLVAIMSRDLSSAYQFLQIAHVYKEAGQRSKALEWAERGLKAFAKDPDQRLEDFVADEYHRRRRHDEAMALVWGQFERRPCLGGYAHLKKHAGRAKQWPSWRQKALELIHKRTGEAMRQSPKADRWSRWVPPDHSSLVEIYLWEKDVESAWQEAQVGGCSDYLWMGLAKLREKDHPADAVAIYRKQIAPIVSRTNNEAYREAAELLRKVNKLMSRLDQDADFAEFLAALRATHRRKRNFMAMVKDL